MFKINKKPNICLVKQNSLNFAIDSGGARTRSRERANEQPKYQQRRRSRAHREDLSEEWEDFINDFKRTYRRNNPRKVEHRIKINNNVVIAAFIFSIFCAILDAIQKTTSSYIDFMIFTKFLELVVEIMFDDKKGRDKDN